MSNERAKYIYVNTIGTLTQAHIVFFEHDRVRSQAFNVSRANGIRSVLSLATKHGITEDRVLVTETSAVILLPNFNPDRLRVKVIPDSEESVRDAVKSYHESVNKSSETKKKNAIMERIVNVQRGILDRVTVTGDDHVRSITIEKANKNG